MKEVNIFMCFILLGAVVALPYERSESVATNDELARVLQSSDGSVPDYEVVPIHLPKFQKRSVSQKSFTFKAFGEHIRLWLNPMDGKLVGEKTKFYKAKMTANGPELFRYNAIRPLIPFIYENIYSATSLAIVRGNKGQTSITGTIRPGLAIRPLPEHLVHNVTKHRRSLDGNMPESEHKYYPYHIVYKTGNQSKATKPLKIPLNSTLSEFKRPRTLLAKKVIYIELLIVVDNHLRQLFKDYKELVVYLLAFWNAVDMEYRNFENPKIRLNIAGIIVAEDDAVLEYIDNNRYNSGVLIGPDVLYKSGPWLLKMAKFIPDNSYDAAITMTADLLCERYAYRTGCYNGFRGIAFLSSICKSVPEEDFNQKTALIQDIGFSGILTTAHELGHLLGASHDDHEKSENCSGGNKIMVGPSETRDRIHGWSACSLNAIHQFLNTTMAASCLRNNPKTGNILPELLPGKLMSPEKQCKKNFGQNYTVYLHDKNICKELYCVDWSTNIIIYDGKTYANNGAECGHEKVCLQGECIDINEI